MASSGKFTKAYHTGYHFELNWKTNSQDIANNTSSVTFTLKLVTDSGYDIRSGINKDITLTINGTKYTGSHKPDISGSSSITLMTKTVTITHSSDGTKSFTASAAYDIEVTLGGTYYGTFSVSGTVTLDSIPRNSIISSVTSSVSVTGSNAVSISLTRYSSGFHHTVKIAIGSYSHSITNVGTSTSYTIPTSWLNAIPNATSGTATVTVTTYNSADKKIGSSVSKTFKITAPSSVKPTFTDLVLTRVDGVVPSAWGVYVQGYSKVACEITGAAGVYGSTIKTYSIKVGNLYSSTSRTFTTDFLTTAGSVAITATVTDSRGRTATMTKTITVVAYTVPKITGADMYRALANGTPDPKNGTYLGGTVDWEIASVGGHNTATGTVRYKRSGAAEFTSLGAISDNVPFVLGNGALDVLYSYDIAVTVTDALGNSVPYVGTISTGFTLINFAKGGRAMGIGKISEIAETLEIDLDTVMYDDLTVQGHLNVPSRVLWQGALYMKDTHTVNLSENVSAQTNGIVLCWSAFADGVAKDYNWVYTFVPKWHVSVAPGTGVACTGVSVNATHFMGKYVYVYDDRIVGNAGNNVTDTTAVAGSNIKRDNVYWVLRAVLGV